MGCLFFCCLKKNKNKSDFQTDIEYNKNDSKNQKLISNSPSNTNLQHGENIKRNAIDQNLIIGNSNEKSKNVKNPINQNLISDISLNIKEISNPKTNIKEEEKETSPKNEKLYEKPDSDSSTEIRNYKMTNLPEGEDSNLNKTYKSQENSIHKKVKSDGIILNSFQKGLSDKKNNSSSFTYLRPNNLEDANKNDFKNYIENKDKLMRCPHCMTYIQYEYGCYFMTCSSNICNSKKFFCLICQYKINLSDKSKHFPKGPYNFLCINKKLSN